MNGPYSGPLSLSQERIHGVTANLSRSYLHHGSFKDYIGKFCFNDGNGKWKYAKTLSQFSLCDCKVEWVLIDLTADLLSLLLLRVFYLIPVIVADVVQPFLLPEVPKAVGIALAISPAKRTNKHNFCETLLQYRSKFPWSKECQLMLKQKRLFGGTILPIVKTHYLMIQFGKVCYPQVIIRSSIYILNK